MVSLLPSVKRVEAIWKSGIRFEGHMHGAQAAIEALIPLLSLYLYFHSFSFGHWLLPSSSLAVSMM